MTDTGATRTAQYRISEDDYVRTLRLYARPSRRVLAALALLVLALIAAMALGSPAYRPYAFGGLLWVIITAVLGRLLPPLIARRHYRKYPAMQLPQTVGMDVGGLQFSSQNGHARLPWSHIVKWREDNRFVLAYVMPRLFYPIPKAVAEHGFDLQELTACLRRHVGEAR